MLLAPPAIRTVGWLDKLLAMPFIAFHVSSSNCLGQCWSQATFPEVYLTILHRIEDVRSTPIYLFFVCFTDLLLCLIKRDRELWWQCLQQRILVYMCERIFLYLPPPKRGEGCETSQQICRVWRSVCIFPHSTAFLWETLNSVRPFISKALNIRSCMCCRRLTVEDNLSILTEWQQ